MLTDDQLKAAISGAAILRVLSRDSAPTAPSAIAAEADRPTKNIGRELDQLRAAGLIDADNAITDDGRAAVAALARAGDPNAGGASSGDQLLLTHAEILPNPDNDRKDWDSEEAKADLDALRVDILQNGLLQNLVVRPAGVLDDAKYVLVGGERRWRAIGLAIQDGDWPAERLIACRLLSADEVGLRLAALSENLQRRNLNPIEEAHAYRGLTEAGLSTADIAERVSLTQRHVQARLQLLEHLSEADQARMTLPKDDPNYLGVKAAREMVQQAEAKRKRQADWLANRTPRQRLILAEMRFAAGSWWGNPVQVQPEAIAADDDAVALDKAGLLRTPHAVDSSGEATAALTGDAWQMFRDFDLPYHGDVKADPDLVVFVEALRTELGVENAGEGYSTSWMNGPFEVSPELQARIDAQKAEQAERDAKWKADREAREAAEQASEEAWAKVLEQARAERTLQAAHPTMRPQADRIVAITGALNHPLPWTAAPNGGLVDANGEVVELDSWRNSAHEQALCEIVALAVNSAAELATPAEPVLPEEERPLTREAFEAKLAEEIDRLPEGDRAELRGATPAQILDAYLDSIGASFGHPDYGWTAGDVYGVLGDYEAPEAEAAAAEDGDDDLPPSVQRLAGVKAQAEPAEAD